MHLSRLLRRRHRAHATAGPPPTLDRSALLAELEVSVPAPERLVRWDTAIGRPAPAGEIRARDQRLSST
jgi:hypothetical protein